MNSINSQTKLNNTSLINQTERSNTILVNTSQLSTFDKSFDKAMTFNSGKVVPILIQQMEPGDTINIKTNTQIRLSNMLTNPLSTINYDVNYFFVPWDYLDPLNKEFFGERKEKRTNEYSIDKIKNPKLTSQASGDLSIIYDENDLGGYLGLPINKRIDVIRNIKPFLAYGKIWNEWYRDQNYQDSIDITSVFGKSTRELIYNPSINNSFLTSIIQGKKLAPSNKLPDYFTSILPSPQLGQAVTIDLSKITLQMPSIPIMNNLNAKFASDFVQPAIWDGASQKPLRQGAQLGVRGGSGNDGGFMAYKAGTFGTNENQALFAFQTRPQQVESNVSGGISISKMREALTYQHLLERLSLTGSRYIEQLKSLYGVEIDVKILQRSELVGGFNDNLIFSSVVQTSASTNNDLLGKLGTNLNNTIQEDNSIQYSASLHGYIVGLMTCRTPINYGGQGFPEMFDEEDSLDVHNPLFNGISEQPVKRKRLYYEHFDLGAKSNDEILGYNEPFQHLKQNYSTSCGYLSLNSNVSIFKYYLYGQKYTKDTIINNEFMEYDPNIIGNTLFKVNDSHSIDKNEFYHQFIASFYFDIKYTTQQPLFNSPGVNYI